jgi:hypothetical protein
MGLDPAAGWPSGLGKGLQSPVRGFDSRSRLGGRLVSTGTMYDGTGDWRSLASALP